MSGQLKVTLVKSAIGYSQKQRENLKGLGLKKIRQVRILEDTPAVRGMVNKVRHLVECEEA